MLGHTGLCNQTILVLEKVSPLGVLAKVSDKFKIFDDITIYYYYKAQHTKYF